jgi:hypothetical protein
VGLENKSPTAIRWFHVRSVWVLDNANERWVDQSLEQPFEAWFEHPYDRTEQKPPEWVVGKKSGLSPT